MTSRGGNTHTGRYGGEVRVLATQISFLEEEIAALRRRLADSPRQARLLEERLREAETNLAGVTGQNERLAGTLREARDQIAALREVSLLDRCLSRAAWPLGHRSRTALRRWPDDAPQDDPAESGRGQAPASTYSVNELEHYVITSWSKTLRYCAIKMVVRVLPAALALLYLAHQRL